MLDRSGLIGQKDGSGGLQGRRMFAPEDCRHGGNIDFEEFGVGG